jgi:peroxiredoxin
MAGDAARTTTAPAQARIALMKRVLLVLAVLALAGCGKPPAPEVRFAALSGESFSTSQLRGKVVLVNFWATWCTDCVREMPKMVETYRKFAPRGYEMVAVAVQSDPPSAVAEFAKRRALPFRVALDSSGEIARRFGQVRITPSSFLIDREGRIVKQFVGEPDWAEFHALIERTL